jgi:hypothetical protein
MRMAMNEPIAGEDALKDHYGRMLGLTKPWCVNEEAAAWREAAGDCPGLYGGSKL